MRMSTPAGQGLPPLSARIIWHHCYVITQTSVFMVAVEGLDEGFPIGFDPARCNLWSVARNHLSSLCNREVVAQYIAHEVSVIGSHCWSSGVKGDSH